MSGIHDGYLAKVIYNQTEHEYGLQKRRAWSLNCLVLVLMLFILAELKFILHILLTHIAFCMFF